MTNFLISLKECQTHINKILKKYLYCFSKNKTQLTLAMEYGLCNGGKRLRAFLVYQVGALFKIPKKNLDNIAAAIECIHAYSLIHDDLPAMDNGDLRRGLPSCHVKYGEYLAILAGDALQTLAFHILSSIDMPDVSLLKRIKIISILANAIGGNGMCLGQSLDLETQGLPISIKKLKTIHKNKTGALIYAALNMTILAGNICDKKITYDLKKYAQLIGLAFQIQDDILNIIGTAQKTGKRQGSDKKSHKNTYSSLLGLKKAQKKALNLYKQALITLEYMNKLGYNTKSLIALAHYFIIRDQ
ncbi:geranyltranstransferase [Wigglesworthia glossinidia endosymbiont of Glossina morsitans morsitans (Yale colony)]|uniref:Geranyltranstransferase n=1 Tax=Wigglesworthia glossinidia endosymbiont of Glossina morsitans morsitans (Yale colony) TaxID=1142511 RepID=H6Q5G8_WIGGL|nr:(2E,6E)-farnesyl diphosphate synthase [Wigglesworthia glossinidia]AFA41451.1 geranyltranstransferase [Wigglesworthia glossinidia endosymbiont of Glossina morsitans morsitans (Yale colony)]